ncbi:MAG: hypothetical protein IPK58_17190 [Acidobacteria bacterium]|nr:hypothetical protein [Acidobacteriota bacterium]
MKPNFYSLKPKTREGFKTAVAWFGGREMIASLKGMIMYMIYGENMDPRAWMKGNIFPNVDEKIRILNEEKFKRAIKAEGVNASEGEAGKDFGRLNAVVETKAQHRMRSDDHVLDETAKAATLAWARKIADYWKWKGDNFEFWDEFLRHPRGKQFRDDPDSIDEFWFDFMADTGDGQMGVYNVGCIALNDLWVEGDGRVGSKVKLMPSKSGKPADVDFEAFSVLPRGYFLFVGGDTAYHSANFATLVERFQLPFRWAFTGIRHFMFRSQRPKDVLFNGKCFWDDSEMPIVDPDTKKMHPDWDGTVGLQTHRTDVDDAKRYWDTEPPRPIFGIPANHDYYDNIDGFNRQFRRTPFDEVEENRIYDGMRGRMFLRIPTFSREQEASYVAIRLPFDWWFFGVDSENEKLDFRQEIFFKNVVGMNPKKLIVATPEPTTVFGRKCDPEDKTAVYLKTITEGLGYEQPFLNNGKIVPLKAGEKTGEFCRLDLSGDVHHYARYWGPETRGLGDPRFSSDNYASVVAGGGGAFFDSTSTLVGFAKDELGNPILENGRKVSGEIPPQQIFPGEETSIQAHAARLFDLENISRGGYVQYAGAICSAIILFSLIYFSNFSGTLAKIEGFFAHPIDSLYSIYLFFAEKNGIWHSAIMLPVIMALLLYSAYSVHSLVVGLKRRNNEDKLDPVWDGRILQLLKTSETFFAAVVLYVFFVVIQPFYGISRLHGIGSNLTVLHHLVLGVILVWLSAEYTNWLAIRAKIARGFKEKSCTEKLEDPNEPSNSWSKRQLGRLARRYSYKYLAANVIGVLAVVAVVFGIGGFGRSSLRWIAADFVFLFTVGFGIGFFLYLAAVTGAAYLPARGKLTFLGFGIWHALLQVTTPLIVFYYADWKVFLGLYVLILLTNGASTMAMRIGSLFRRNSRIYDLFRFRLGEKLMKSRKNRSGMTVAWISLGLIMLVAPIASHVLLEKPVSLFRLSGLGVQEIGRAARSVLSLAEANSEIKEGNVVALTPEGIAAFVVAIVLIAIIGYRLSRVWFGWYLAVTLLYNGHNNEAGGMARIEDYKHLVRIKITKTELTAYVIGLEKAVPDMTDEGFKLEIVDKFTLTSAPPTAT